MASSIPRFSHQPVNNTVDTPETSTAQGAAAPRERRTLHQMEQELNEWAKYPAKGENRIDTKEKILAAYQNPPELLELKNIGWSFIATSGDPFCLHKGFLPKCLEDLDCRIKCEYSSHGYLAKHTSMLHIVETGTFKYIPELEGVFLTEGTREQTDVFWTESREAGSCEHQIFDHIHYVQTGTFEYIQQLNHMELTNGTTEKYHNPLKLSYPEQFSNHKEAWLKWQADRASGRTTPQESTKGIFEYIPQLNNMQLTNGTITAKDTTTTGIFEYIPQLQRMEMTKGVILCSKKLTDSYTIRGIWEYIPQLHKMQQTKGSYQSHWSSWIGTRQYNPQGEQMGMTKGTIREDSILHPTRMTGTWDYNAPTPVFKGIKEPYYYHSKKYNNDNDCREEGTFQYTKNRDWLLKEGIVTQHNGTRKQVRNPFTLLDTTIFYTSTKKLPRVAPLVSAAKITAPTTPSLEPGEELTWEIECGFTEPENTAGLEAQPGTSGSISQDEDEDETAAESSNTSTTVQQPTASSSASPRVPLLVSTSFAKQHADNAANGLTLAHMPQGEQLLSLKVLPPDLQNKRICAQFFADYSQAMQQLYDKTNADALGYSNIEASPWSRIASVVLSSTGIIGLPVCGRLLRNLSQHINKTEAANKANSILGHFCRPHQFDALSSHMAVRLTRALEPQLGDLLLQSTNALNPLKLKVNEWMQAQNLRPIQNLSPFALLTALVCMKLLRNTPPADRQTQLNNNYLTELTDHLVSKVLCIINTDAEPEAVWRDVREVPSSAQLSMAADQPAQPTLTEIAENLRRTEEIANTALLGMQQQLKSAQAENQALQNTLTEELSRLETELKTLNASHCPKEQVSQLELLINTVKAHAEEHQNNANQRIKQLVEATQGLQTKKMEMEKKIRDIQSAVQQTNTRSELLINTQQLQLRNTHTQTITHMVGSSRTSISQPQPRVDVQFQQEVKMILSDFSEQMIVVQQGVDTSQSFIQEVAENFSDLSQRLLMVRNELKNEIKQSGAGTQQQLETLSSRVEQQKALLAETTAENAALKNELEDIKKQNALLAQTTAENTALKNEVGAIKESQMMESTIKTVIDSPRRLEAIATQYFQGLGLSFEHKQKQYLHYNTPSTYRKMIVGKKMEQISVSDLVKICLTSPSNLAPKSLIKAMLGHLLRPSDIAAASLTLAGNRRRLYEAVLNTASE